MKRTVAVLFGALVPALAHGQGERVATHLITSNEVVIARPAMAIWPYIMDPSTWKQSNTLVHRSGPNGATGEVFAAVSAASPQQVEYFLENAEVTPGRRRVIKLYTPGGVLIGFAAFVLSESGGRTTVRYDVYSEVVLSPAERASQTAAARAEAERVTREATMKRFDAELRTLKQLVESR
ncbi:MAG: hypothetical protein JNJ98_19855 [Gemmatimonadetes bacterium]|nr:hypothetical protein [Gemmatimonadota bacterium]